MYGILTVFAAAVILTVIVRLYIAKLQKYVLARKERKVKQPAEYQKRVETVFRVLGKFAYFVIWTVSIMIVLSMIGLSMGPIIALLGILGAAVGFGSQGIIKDLINGFFIILENQIRIGDVVAVNGKAGVLEEIDLRKVVLRDVSGAVHIFTNGSIEKLSNMTKGFSAYVFEIRVAYKEEIDKITGLICEAGADLKKDPVLGPKILDKVEVFGLDRFASSSVIIKGRIKTLPRQHRTVGREFNRIIKNIFDENGVEIPFAHKSFYFGSDSKEIKTIIKG